VLAIAGAILETGVTEQVQQQSLTQTGMNTADDQRKLLWFMGGLVFVAIVINSLCYRPAHPPPILTVSQPLPPAQPKSVEVNNRAVESNPARNSAPPERSATASPTWTSPPRPEEDRTEAVRKAAEIAAEAERIKAAQQAAEAARRAAEEAAAEHARYLARYLTAGIARTPGSKALAVVAASENSRVNRAVTAAIANRFKTNSLEVLSSFFTPEFVSDGVLNQVLADPQPLFEKLELAKTLDMVVLARQKVRYTTNPSLENVITANMELEVAVLPIESGVESHAWTFTANGAGFKEEAARAMAEERLLKQIATDTKPSLSQ
jgi:hypothetical protein